MKILHIASLFPLKDSPKENPYVRDFNLIYKKKNNSYKPVILKPVTYLPFFTWIFSNKRKYWKYKNNIAEKKQLKENDIEIVILPYIAIGSNSFAFPVFSFLAFYLNFKKFKYLLSQNFDLIQAHYLFPDGLFAYLMYSKFGIPYTLTLQQEKRFLKNTLSRFLTKKIIINSYKPATLSYQMKEAIEELKFPNIELLSIGINDLFFQSINSKRIENISKIKLVSVCNLLPVKNISSVITAISRIDQKQKIAYDVYGSGQQENELKQMTSDLELSTIIEFKGEINNTQLIDVLPNYDLFIQPSFKESFGLSYFEALACGLPVIITENTGAYQLIKDKNVSFLVDPNNINSIVDCLEKIINNPKLIVEKSINTFEVAKIASWDNFINYFDFVYRTAIPSEKLQNPSISAYNT